MKEENKTHCVINGSWHFSRSQYTELFCATKVYHSCQSTFCSSEELQLLTCFADDQAEAEKNEIPCQEPTDSKLWIQDSPKFVQTPWSCCQRCCGKGEPGKGGIPLNIFRQSECADY